MAKRNTSGKPRKQRTEDVSARPLSRAERDRILQRNVLIGAGGVAAFVVLLLIIGLVVDTVIEPSQSITTVNGQDIETRDFQQRVRAERWLVIQQLRDFYEETEDFTTLENQILTLDRQPENIGSRVLDDMELAILLEEEAALRDVTVDNDAIEAQVEQYASNFTGVSLTQIPSSTPTERPLSSLTPFITATASHTPTITPTITQTPLPPIEGCEDPTDCPTVTPLPTTTATPTSTPSATPTATNTPLAQDEIRATQERFESDLYGDADEEADVNEDILRDIFYLQALREAMQEAVTDEMIAMGDIQDTRVGATARHILIGVPEDLQRANFSESLCESEDWLPYSEEADRVLELLNGGESFAAMAQAFSTDGSASNGGLLGAVNDVDTQYVEPFAQAIRDGEVGEYLGPVCSQFGFHIIQVLEKEINPIPERELEQVRSEEYRQWEIDLITIADIQRRSDWEERIPDTPEAEDLLGDIIDENN
jgi:peptidyl-prolyl cis-trans isomerase D